MGTKVTYFDVEWANSTNMSICQMGLMCEDFGTDDPCLPELSVFINPEDGFDPVCVRVHGITKERVCREKTFPEVWKTVEPYFTNAIVVGHNVGASDLHALEKTLSRYNIDIPELYYVDTYEIARNVIPRCYLPDERYSLDCLCSYFDIDMENHHDAFDDACACKDVLKALMHLEPFEISKYVHRYESSYQDDFINYVSSPKLRQAITDYYGVAKGIMADNVINDEERIFLENWKKDNSNLLATPELKRLIDYVDGALSDGILTESEIEGINSIIAEYYSTIKAAPETTATQVLDGILKGLSADKKINTSECTRLESWLYDNAFLKGHFPYDRVMSIVENVLEDGVVTQEESDYLLREIDGILNPVAELHSKVDSIEGKKVCLSGIFKYGQKSKVAEYVASKGGTVEDGVKKSTDVLVVGELECEAYSNGTYGTKVKKAMEFKNKGCHITIMKESELFSI